MFLYGSPRCRVRQTVQRLLPSLGRVQLTGALGRGALNRWRGQRQQQFWQILHHHSQSHVTVLAAVQQCKTQIATIGIRILSAMISQQLHLSAQLGFGAGRQHDQPARLCGMAALLEWRLTNHHMCIGAAGAEGTDCRQPSPCGPWAQRGIDEKRTVLERNRWIATAVMQRGRNLLVLERQQNLNDAGHAGCVLGVADIGLYRAQRAKLLETGLRTERLAQCAELDRVAEFGARTMRLDHLNFGWVDLETPVYSAQQRFLGFRARRSNTVGGTVLIHTRAADHAIYVVAIGLSIGQALEHQHTHTFAWHKAVRLRGESMTATALGQHASTIGRTVKLGCGL